MHRRFQFLPTCHSKPFELMKSTRISYSPNGWTDGELARNWIEQEFNHQTEQKANGRTRVLLLDGHKSHYTQELLHYAQSNNILILGYPPHCTHALQGLDVVCFAQMKEIWKEELNIFEENHNRSVSEADFIGVFGTAFIRAFTPETITAAFEATGVHPFNESAISDIQMRPSLPTSTKGTFPLPQPSPVQRVISAFRRNTFTAPTNELPPLQQPAGEINEQAPTPTLISSALSTSSASYLVSDIQITSTHCIISPIFEHSPAIPEPDWSLIDLPNPFKTTQSKPNLEEQVAHLKASLVHARKHITARNSMIEANHVQMIIQDLHLQKLNKALQAKEKKKKDDHTILFPGGHGRCLTEQAFINAIDQQAERIVQEEHGKRVRAEARAQKRVLREAIDNQWRAAMTEWEQEKSEVEKLQERLLAQGTLRKNLPKAPPRPKKAEISARVMEARGFGGEIDEDDVGDEDEVD